MNLAYNVAFLSELSNPDWDDLVNNGVAAAVICFSHGITQDNKAADNIANAKKAGMYIHGYHIYEGLEDEVIFSMNNAKSLGLQPGSYMFLKGAPTDLIVGFTNNWLSVGWKVGINSTSNDCYQWIRSDAEPANYDLWQMDDSLGYDATGNLVIEPVSPVPKVDSFNPPLPEDGAFVDFGKDTTGLLGGTSLGYSTNGDNFYAVVTPFGMVFRDADANRMSKLLMNKLKLQSPNGTVFSLSISDDGELKAIKENEGKGA